MRYTGFKLSKTEVKLVSAYVKDLVSHDLGVIEDSMNIMETSVTGEMERLVTVGLMEGALMILERDGLVKFEEVPSDHFEGNESALFFWVGDRLMTKKFGATERGEILSQITTNKNHMDLVMKGVVEVGKAHPEYVSELLYVCYGQVKTSIAEQTGSFWTKKHKTAALAQLEDVYGRYMVDPEAEASAA